MTEPIRCRVCARPVRVRTDGTAGRHKASGDWQCAGTGRPTLNDPPCVEACRPVGTVGWPLTPARGEAHASTHVCDSPSHQDEARAWVHRITGHAGVFRSFAEARRKG